MIMKFRYLIFTFVLFAMSQSHGQEIASKASYLEKIKAEMLVEWPKNRTINLVFHGHSVTLRIRSLFKINPFLAFHYDLISIFNL